MRKWRTIACPSLAFFEFLCFSKNCVVNLFVSPFQLISKQFNSFVREENNNYLGEFLIKEEENKALISIYNSEILTRRASFCIPPNILQVILFFKN